MTGRVKKKIKQRFAELYLDVGRPSVNAVKKQLAAEGYDTEAIEQTVRETLSATPSQVRVIGPCGFWRRLLRALSQRKKAVLIRGSGCTARAGAVCWQKPTGRYRELSGGDNKYIGKEYD